MMTAKIMCNFPLIYIYIYIYNLHSDWTGRIPRMLTMLKLFKLGRLLQFIQLFMDKIALHYKIKPGTNIYNFDLDSSRRMSYFVGVLFVVHIFTCAWYLQVMFIFIYI